MMDSISGRVICYSYNINERKKQNSEDTVNSFVAFDLWDVFRSIALIIAFRAIRIELVRNGICFIWRFEIIHSSSIEQ